MVDKLKTVIDSTLHEVCNSINVHIVRILMLLSVRDIMVKNENKVTPQALLSNAKEILIYHYNVVNKVNELLSKVASVSDYEDSNDYIKSIIDNMTLYCNIIVQLYNTYVRGSLIEPVRIRNASSYLRNSNKIYKALKDVRNDNVHFINFSEFIDYNTYFEDIFKEGILIISKIIIALEDRQVEYNPLLQNEYNRINHEIMMKNLMRMKENEGVAVNFINPVPNYMSAQSQNGEDELVEAVSFTNEE